MTVNQILAKYPHPVGLVVQNGLYGVVVGFGPESLCIRFVEGRIGTGWKYADQEMDVIPESKIPGHLKAKVTQVLDELTK